MEQTGTAIQTLTDDWAQAENRGDVTALRDLLHDAFVGVALDGRIFHKATWLQRYRSGDLVNQVFSWRTIEARTYGEMALVVGQLDQISSFRGHDASACLTVTLVVTIRGCSSQLLGLHASTPTR